MKRFLIALFICLLPFGVMAQQDQRSPATAILPKSKLAEMIDSSIIGSVLEMVLSPDSYHNLLYETVELDMSAYEHYDKQGNLKDVDFLNYPGIMYRDGHNRIDDKIRPYIEQEDADLIKKYTRGIYDGENGFYNPGFGRSEVYYQQGSEKNLFGVLGSYAWGSTDALILRNDVVESGDKALIQDVTHHILQYVKDSAKIADDFVANEKEVDWRGAEYLAFDYFVEGMTPTTEAIFHGILNARAYSEEMVFLYNKKEDLYDKMKKLEAATKELQNGTLFPLTPEYKELEAIVLSLVDKDTFGAGIITNEKIASLYEQIKTDYEQFEKRYNDIINSGKNPAAIAFGKAIEEGKTVEEARHIAAVALLDSDLYSTILEVWRKVQNSVDPNNYEKRTLSAEEIIRMLGDDMFTLEDFYSAEKFWVDLCSSDYKVPDYYWHISIINSEECKKAQERWQSRHCNNSICGDEFDYFASRFIYNPEGKPIERNKETFEKIDKTFDADKNICGMRFKNGKRRLTSKEDEEKLKTYRVCCTLDWNFSLDYNWNK